MLRVRLRRYALGVLVLLVGCNVGSGLPRVSGVEIHQADRALRVGDVARFEATVQGRAHSGAVVWQVSDPRVASVASSGELVALAAGSVDLEAVSAIDPEVLDSRRVSVYALAPASPPPLLPGVGEAQHDGRRAPVALMATSEGWLLESLGVTLAIVGPAAAVPWLPATQPTLRLRVAGLAPQSVALLELHGSAPARAEGVVAAAGVVELELSHAGLAAGAAQTLLLTAFDAQGGERSLAVGVWVGDPAGLPPAPAEPDPEVPAPQPELQLSQRSVVLRSAAAVTIDVTNCGEPGSLLHFDVSSLAPWLVVERLGEGDVAAECHCGIRIRLCGTAPVATGASTTILITSNAGTANVSVSVGEGVGPSICALGNPAAAALSALTAGPVATLVAALTPPSAPPASDPWSVTQEALVVFEEVAPQASAVAALAQRVAAVVVRVGEPGHHDVWRLPATGTGAAAAALAADPSIRYVVPNLPVQRLAPPNDRYYPDQWSAWCFGLAGAWAEVADAGGPEVVLAVVDDGLLVSHPDIAARVLPGFDFAHGDSDVTSGDGNWHGTHVAGIAAAIANNGIGIAGVANTPAVRVLPVKVFPDVGATTSLADLIDGMRWSVGIPVRGAPTNPHPAQVVNLSLGVEVPQPVPDDYASFVAYFERVVAEMHARGAVVVAAAGNAGYHAASYPARVDAVIGVGSVDYRGLRSGFSNYGYGLDLMAPGGYAPVGVGCYAVVSLYRNGDTPGYACAAGTSMAAPYVAGVAALLIAQSPASYAGNPTAVAARLASTALFAPGMLANLYGAGIVCPDAALGASAQCGWPAP